MAKHNDLGQHGENIAAEFLLQKNYKILTINYRYRRAEIDIIAKIENTLVFVEVKTRSDDYLYDPEKALTTQKQRLVQKAAYHYMRTINHDWAFRFDLIAIVTKGKGRYEIRHVEDAFI